MSILRTAVQYGATSNNLINVEIDTAYNFGDGNHTIKVSGDKTDVRTGDGKNYIKSYGNEANVITGDGDNEIVSYGNDSHIVTGNGDQKITSIGDNKTIITDNGDDEVTFIGDGCSLNAGNGNNKVIFWGNDTNIVTGEGNDDFKTFDQIYNEEDYSDLAQAFIETLPTGIWEDWNKISRHQIDYICQKSLMSKSQTWVYEDTYEVYTIFSRYINGLKNVNIDMGGGNNTASLTVDKATANIIDNGQSVLTKDAYGNIKENDTPGDIKFNEDDSLDTVLDTRNETKIDVKTKSNTRWGGVFVAAAIATIATIATWGAAAPLMTGALAACGASAATAATVGTAIGCGLGAMGAIAGSISLSEIGYKAATGQTLHTGDWVNAGASALAFAGGWAAVAGNAMRGTYAASQGDYVGAAVSFAAAGLGATGADCLGNGTIEGTDQLTTIGKIAHGVNLAANGVNIVDKGIKIAEGDAKFADWASLGTSMLSACYSGTALSTGSDAALATSIKKEEPEKDTGKDTAKDTANKKPSTTSGEKPTNADSNAKTSAKTTPDKNSGTTSAGKPGTEATNTGTTDAKTAGANATGSKDLGDYMATPGNTVNKWAENLGNKLGANGNNMVGNIIGTGVSWAGQIIGTPIAWAGELVGDAASLIGVSGKNLYNISHGTVLPSDTFAAMNGAINHAFRNDEEYDDEPTLKW